MITYNKILKLTEWVLKYTYQHLKWKESKNTGKDQSKYYKKGGISIWLNIHALVRDLFRN